MSEQTDTEYDRIIEKYKLNYSLLKFIPKQQSIQSSVSACVVEDEDTGILPINMKQIDNSPYHTAETCKMKAAVAFSDIKYKEKLDSQNNPDIKTPGLSYRIYIGTTGDNTRYFVENKNNLIDEGITTDFNFENIKKIDTPFNAKIKNIMERNGGSYDIKKTGANNFRYSIEFYGFIIPDVTGNWTFAINSDDSSLLWIGDNAILNYTPGNATINNGGYHGSIKKSESIYLETNKEYPIRIQYWENWGAYFFDLTVQPPKESPNYNNTKYYKVLFQKEKSLLYYALVKNKNNPKYYSCYVTDTNIKPNTIKNSDLMVTELPVPALSQLSCENITISPEGNIPGLSFLIAGLKVAEIPYDNKTIDNFFLILSSKNGKVSLELWQFINKLYTFFKIDIPNDSKVNPQWLMDANRNPINSETKPIITVLTTPNFPNKHGLSGLFDKYHIRIIDKIDTVNPLISFDGRFKLIIKKSVQKPVLLYSKKACTQRNKSVPYTDDNTRLLNKVDINNTLNKRFYSDELSKKITFVPTSNTLLKPNGQYMNVGNFAPSGDISTINENNIKMDGKNKKCNEICNETAGCNYYYNYTTIGGDKMCYIEKNYKSDNILSNDILNTVNPEIMKDSSLYVKDYNINFNNNYNLKIKNKKIENKEGGIKYEGYSFSNKSLLESETVPQELIDWQKKQDAILNGRPNSVTESFDNKICVTGDCINIIKNDKIKPLMELSDTYHSNVNKLIETDMSLNTKIIEYNNVKQILSNNNQYQYTPSDTYDTNGKKNTIYDGINEDINELLVQENNMYILGTITTATLLILAIMLSMN